MGDLHVFALRGGRDLAWSELGSATGAAVVALHGSPGSGHDFDPVAEVAAECGVRIVAVDRPGYGHSTFDPRRTYQSSAADIGELAEHLGLERFGVVGWSSGGPNAAACARFLGHRLVGCAIVSGPAPPESRISKEAMPRAIRVGQRLAVLAPRLAGTLFEAGLRQGRRDPEKSLAWMLQRLPPCDAAVVDRPDVRAVLLADLNRPVSATAGRASTQDLVLESRPWGFALHDLAVPVHVWHGEADRNVALANGVFQAREIPDVTLHQLPAQGHWLLVDHFQTIVESLHDS